MDKIVVTVLTKWLHLVTELTTTIMESCPLDSGSSVMKLTLTYGIPWCVGNQEQMQFPHWRLFDCFAMETHVTGGDILAYVFRHLWPPVIPGYQLQSFPSSGVSSYLGVMAESYDSPAKICFWDIDFSSVA